jgi:hypothetical protein
LGHPRIACMEAACAARPLHSSREPHPFRLPPA